MPEFILCAAIKYKGFTVPGFRHFDCYRLLNKLLHINTAVAEFTEGFLTSENRFVNRNEAFTIAKNAGQIITEAKIYDTYELRSEDLY